MLSLLLLLLTSRITISGTMNSHVIATFLLLTTLICVTDAQGPYMNGRNPPQKNAQGYYEYYTQKDKNLAPISPPGPQPYNHYYTEKDKELQQITGKDYPNVKKMVDLMNSYDFYDTRGKHVYSRPHLPPWRG
ncbi:hypothetical protein Y032_0025g1186 [Ancylostoma ceylanicum]|nr:hypothetical protein Y032_0025g1186 [Ancylostoma ceylanicum]